jgi:glycosyltransferase involved in cell wall biosynthesis
MKGSTPHGGTQAPNRHATELGSTGVIRLRADFETLRVVVLTTSYPRGPDDVAGVFVRDAVEHLREAGVDVDVVSPAAFRHFGLAYGYGIVGNLRRRPWLVAVVPLFLVSYARAARLAARDADLVHAHWLPSALPALATGKPFVVQLWGTDAELARRAPWLARRLLRRARLAIVPSQQLAAYARSLGARHVVAVPGGVQIPDDVAQPEDPPHVLYVGRLSEEKGVRELAAATDGLPRVVVGDGPLRSLFPDAVGFVPPSELGPYYERASVVACPSRREGYGVVAREAMAHGRPVVASAVGGLVDAVDDGSTGLLVPPSDPGALRQALTRLLEDDALRRRLSEAGRKVAQERWSWNVAINSMLEAYASAVEGD